MKSISADTVKSWLGDRTEFGFIDVREDGQFGEGHLLHTVPLPYSRLEIDAPGLMPCVSIPIVVVDDGKGVAERAAKRLEAIGYTDVRVLEGGLRAAEKSGFTIFKGVNVPSKTLGELAEEIGHTPSIDAEEMKRMLDAGDDFVLLDGRTPNEFEAMSIPGGRSCPNAELPYRLPQLVDNPKTKVIVNCAGRTRSLVGAQGLRNFGFENPVFALKNGTQGWRLAGFELEHGEKAETLPAVTGKSFAEAKARAASFMKENDIPCVDSGTAKAWSGDAARTFYLLDVRTREEFDTRHLKGAIHAPGGQLAQATDKWVAVRGARIVLCDDSGVRAANTAYWLRAMGHDAYVLSDDVSDASVDLAAPVSAAKSVSDTLDDVTPSDIGAATVVDLRASADYRDAHIENAIWSIRPVLGSLKLDGDVVLVAPDKKLAALAAMDLKDMGVKNVRYLKGAPDDWRSAGLNVVSTPDTPKDRDRIDFLFFVHDRHSGNADASRAYLNWELGLIAQLKDWELKLFPIHDGH